MGDRYVITSAECTHNIAPNSISVLVGDTTLGVANDTSRFFLNVSEIRQHPDYDNDDNAFQNNIAVLVLTSPVDLKAHPNIKPACLPRSNTKFNSRIREAVLSGWGAFGKKMLDEYTSSNLYKAGVKILSNCSEWQGYFQKVNIAKILYKLIDKSLENNKFNQPIFDFIIL